MRRRNSPSILLYGFGLALALSLTFNGALLYQHSHPRHIAEYDSENTVHPAENTLWQQNGADCEEDNQPNKSTELSTGSLPQSTAGADNHQKAGLLVTPVTSPRGQKVQTPGESATNTNKHRQDQ